jgi:signal peptidase II
MNKAILSAVIVLVMTALDLFTKHFAAARIGPIEAIEVLPFLNLVNVQNRGAAFGIFASFGSWFFIGISLAAIVFIIFLLVKTNESPVALSLIMSGAIGNLADRLMFGYVRDFVDVHAGGHHWPAFNVADSALSVGLVLILILPFIHAKMNKEKAEETKQAHKENNQ